MREYGHNAVVGDGFCLDGWGAGPFKLVNGKQVWHFEDSDRFGPLVVTATGHEAEQPPEKSPFWRLYQWWRSQGRQLAPDGETCVWRVAKPTIFRRVGRMKLIVEHGEEGGALKEVAEAEQPAEEGR